jgi:transposase
MIVLSGVKTQAQIRHQSEQIRGSLDERARREWAGSEAMLLGHGGITLLHRATGMGLGTIARGIRELREQEDGESEPASPRRVRRPGGGRTSKVKADPGLVKDLQELLEPATRGDPESPLRWTSKSLRKLEMELGLMGHALSYRTIGRLLKSMEYSLQANRKTLEGTQHPDRNAQFEYINEQVKDWHKNGSPALSVDTKKKELIGDYKNGVANINRKTIPRRLMFTTSGANWAV